ncbi:MAG: hypothetical protein ACE5G0_15755 [Rhodothermales bacterium]
MPLSGNSYPQRVKARTTLLVCLADRRLHIGLADGRDGHQA